MRWFDGVYLEGGSLKDFGKSDTKRGEKFELIAVEYFVSIGEDVNVGLFGVDEIFTAYLMVRNLLLVSRTIASNSKLLVNSKLIVNYRASLICLWLVLKLFRGFNLLFFYIFVAEI